MAMIVSFEVSSGLTKAYRSVLSAAGSPLINGASRWLEARMPEMDVDAMSRAPPMATTRERLDTAVLRCCGMVAVIPGDRW